MGFFCQPLSVRPLHLLLAPMFFEPMSYWVVRNSNTLISFNSFDRKSINFGLRHSANLAVCRLRHWANTFWPFGNTTTEQHREWHIELAPGAPKLVHQQLLNHRLFQTLINRAVIANAVLHSNIFCCCNTVVHPLELDRPQDPFLAAQQQLPYVEGSEPYESQFLPSDTGFDELCRNPSGETNNLPRTFFFSAVAISCPRSTPDGVVLRTIKSSV